MTTTNLSDFGKREIDMAADLLKAYAQDGVRDTFYENGVTLMLNTHSGNVFLTNDECDVLMMNGERLERFYTTPYEGYEGFADDLREMLEVDGAEYWPEEDVAHMIDCGILDLTIVDKANSPNTYEALIEYGFIEEDTHDGF